MKGIKETSELLRFGLNLATGCVKSLADGKITFTDSIHFKDAILNVTDAFDGISEVPAELKDMDAAEAEELKRIAIEEFAIDSEKVEEIVKGAIAIAIDLIKLVTGIKK